MNIKPCILDVVELIKAVKGCTAGTQGVIVHVYNNTIFEVELTDSKGNTLAVETLSVNDIKVIWQYPG
jgi:hypothetical protein